MSVSSLPVLDKALVSDVAGVHTDLTWVIQIAPPFHRHLEPASLNLAREIRGFDKELIRLAGAPMGMPRRSGPGEIPISSLHNLGCEGDMLVAGGSHRGMLP
jgi:hypothetical protein